MQTAPRIDGPLLGRIEASLETARDRVRETLGAAGLSRETAAEAAAGVARPAWTDLLGAGPPLDPEVPIRRAALRAAAGALRRAGAGGGVDPAATPIPEGLTAEALRGAQREVIPGRRSVAGLHLRGYTVGEMAPIYGLTPEEMKDRLDGALEDLRSSLHRRAERMNRASWSRAMESRPIEETFGMLREGPGGDGSRRRCAATSDMAEAVNGTHFRGGREGVLDHAVHCDACARELRVLTELRGRLPGSGEELDAGLLQELRREARSRSDLRPLAAAAAAPRRRRPAWPWLLLLLGGLLLLRLLV